MHSDANASLAPCDERVRGHVEAGRLDQLEPEREDLIIARDGAEMDGDDESGRAFQPRIADIDLAIRDARILAVQPPDPPPLRRRLDSRPEDDYFPSCRG